MILKRFEDYRSVTEATISAELQQRGWLLKAFSMGTAEDMRSRFAPGLILDFPRFSFDIGDIRITGRSCVTVCVAEAASKIWTRLVLDLIPGSDAPSEQTDATLTLASEICGSINVRLRKLYRRDFIAALDPKPHGLELRKIGELNYVGLDEDPAIVACAVRAIESDGAAQGGETVDGLKNRLTSLVDLTRTTPEQVTLPHSGAKLRTYVGRQGEPALFASFVGPTSATFAVASARSREFNKGQRQRLGRERNSAALDVMTELATLMASEF